MSTEPHVDEQQETSVATTPETPAAAAKPSFTISLNLEPRGTGITDHIEIKVSGHSSAKNAVSALYQIAQEAFLANLYEALTGNGIEEEGNDDD